METTCWQVGAEERGEGGQLFKQRGAWRSCASKIGHCFRLDLPTVVLNEALRQKESSALGGGTECLFYTTAGVPLPV